MPDKVVIVKAMSSPTLGRPRKVRAQYVPRRNMGNPYIRFEYMNGHYFGEVVGRAATEMRRDLGLECRVWAVVELFAGGVR